MTVINNIYVIILSRWPHTLKKQKNVVFVSNLNIHNIVLRNEYGISKWTLNILKLSETIFFEKIPGYLCL